VGVATFLARAASLGQHRDHYSLLFDTDTMEPRISSAPFVEALRGLVALKSAGPPGMEEFDAESARKAFRTGHVALLIDRAERVVSWAEGGQPIGVAVLPGSSRVFEPVRKVWETVSRPNRPSYLPFGGGWLIGVSASAAGSEREAAIDFAKYLAGPDTSSRVRSDRAFPMLPFRASQVGQGLPDPTAAAGVESRLWADAVAKTLTAQRVVPGLRIPQADGYLAELDKGRVEAATGKPAEKSLQAVSEAWSTRTEALGAKRQLWHYQQSLNFLLTSPKPPPR
jgi:multiple sugar transport system substrate-binding protein